MVVRVVNAHAVRPEALEVCGEFIEPDERRVYLGWCAWNIDTLAGGSMEKDNHVAETDAVTAHLTEDIMELVTESVTVQPASRTTATNPCTHSRAIDDVLTRGKKRSGKVRCLECQAIFDDPYQGR